MKNAMTIGQTITATIPVTENGSLIWQTVSGVVVKIETFRNSTRYVLNTGIRVWSEYVNA